MLSELGCLATYIGYVSRVSICLCWGWYHNIASFAGWEYSSFTIRGETVWFVYLESPGCGGAG